jgi:hypothetical protein
LTLIAAIEDPPVIAKILTHLGLPIRAPPRSPAQVFDPFQMACSQTDTRFDPVQPPEPTVPFDTHSRKTPTCLDIWRLGLTNGPKTPRFWTED